MKGSIVSSTFSSEALRRVLQEKFSTELSLPDVRSIVQAAAAMDQIGAPAESAVTVTDPTADERFFYQIVFTSLDHAPAANSMFIDVYLSHRLEYGSDLDALRRHLMKLTGYKTMVLENWREMKGPIRPGGVVPSLTMERPADEKHREQKLVITGTTSEIGHSS